MQLTLSCKVDGQICQVEVTGEDAAAGTEPPYGGSTILKTDEETGRNAIYVGTAGSSFGRNLVCASRRAQQFKKSRTGSTSESIGGTLLAGTAESKRIRRDRFFEKGGFWKPETSRICRNERTAAGGTGFYGGEDGQLHALYLEAETFEAELQELVPELQKKASETGNWKV